MTGKVHQLRMIKYVVTKGDKGTCCSKTEFSQNMNLSFIVTETMRFTTVVSFEMFGVFCKINVITPN